MYFALYSGIRFSGMEKFTTIFNTECLAKSSYHKQIDNIVDIMLKQTDIELREAGHRLQERLKSENSDLTDESVLHIIVTFDGGGGGGGGGQEKTYIVIWNCLCYIS